MKSWLPCTYRKVTSYLCNLIISAMDTAGCLAERFLQDGSQWFVVILDMHLSSICILVETLKPKHQ